MLAYILVCFFTDTSSTAKFKSCLMILSLVKLLPGLDSTEVWTPMFSVLYSIECNGSKTSDGIQMLYIFLFYKQCGKLCLQMSFKREKC